jgi:acetylornithine deacetylase/succinyl-diaminopimelate desuccinylase-like protein
MRLNNVRPKRTIHVTFVPDEEIGGYTGLEPFLKCKEFQEMNVGFALDEGQASPNEKFCLYYAERMVWCT